MKKITKAQTKQIPEREYILEKMAREEPRNHHSIKHGVRFGHTYENKQIKKYARRYDEHYER